MKLLKKNIVIILVILVIIFSASLFVTKSERKVLQRNVDLVYTNAISDAMAGLNRDYTKLNRDEKAQLYYQTVSNLHDALDVFYITSYKKHEHVSFSLNQLYHYLLLNKNEDYEFEHTLKIYSFLGKVLVYPEDESITSEFNEFIKSKKKE